MHYTPQPIPYTNEKNVSQEPLMQDPLALVGTSNVLRANGVRLKKDCEFVIPDIKRPYCESELVVTEGFRYKTRCHRLPKPLSHSSLRPALKSLLIL